MKYRVLYIVLDTNNCLKHRTAAAKPAQASPKEIIRWGFRELQRSKRLHDTNKVPSECAVFGSARTLPKTATPGEYK